MKKNFPWLLVGVIGGVATGCSSYAPPEAARQSDEERARVRHERATHPDSLAYKAAIAEAERAIRNRDYQAALQHLEGDWESNRFADVGFHFYRGIALQRLGRTDEAIAEFRQSIGPHESGYVIGAHLNQIRYALLLESRGDMKTARAVYETLIMPLDPYFMTDPKLLDFESVKARAIYQAGQGVPDEEYMVTLTQYATEIAPHDHEVRLLYAIELDMTDYALDSIDQHRHLMNDESAPAWVREIARDFHGALNRPAVWNASRPRRGDVGNLDLGPISLGSMTDDK